MEHSFNNQPTASSDNNETIRYSSKVRIKVYPYPSMIYHKSIHDNINFTINTHLTIMHAFITFTPFAALCKQDCFSRRCEVGGCDLFLLFSFFCFLLHDDQEQPYFLFVVIHFWKLFWFLSENECHERHVCLKAMTTYWSSHVVIVEFSLIWNFWVLIGEWLSLRTPVFLSSENEDWNQNIAI